VAITRVGANSSYADGWDRAFGGKGRKGAAGSGAPKTAPAKRTGKCASKKCKTPGARKKAAKKK